ncbi:hypothetical protein [Roseicitreum antarcticum]|uniref:hypothetical protein n=1 Tax=Roseicitreum antarcticum TaxID=564137 RepID=UPI00115FC2DE|nr:hypothetical protein [Roseicitreum antarcticum]
MEVTLGTPEHGWVDLRIRDTAFFLHDSISDVPADFIDESVIGLTNLLSTGEKQEITLGLEPHYYVITFAKNSHVFSFRLERELEHSHAAERSFLHKSEGSFGQILLPFIDEFVHFYSGQVCESSWPQANPAHLEGLLKAAAVNKAD